MQNILTINFIGKNYPEFIDNYVKNSVNCKARRIFHPSMGKAIRFIEYRLSHQKESLWENLRTPEML